jgi:hypothetical protein
MRHLLELAIGFVESGHEYAKKGLSVLAFYEYAKAEGVIQAITLTINQGILVPTKQEQIVFVTAFSRLEAGMSVLFNGSANPPDDLEDEFREARKVALVEMREIL